MYRMATGRASPSVPADYEERMDVIFLSPAWPLEMPAYPLALHAAGVRVHGVGDTHPTALPDRLRGALASYLHVPAMGDVQAVRAQVRRAVREAGLKPDRVEALWEPLTVLAAELRGDFGITGMSPDVVLGFRDKAVMRARVAAAGLRVPRTVRVASRTAAWAAAEAIGFPVVLKPVDGAGSADTTRCDSAIQFEAALQATSGHNELLVEEFIDGPEFTYETLCIDGVPVYESVCRYEPNTLVARQNQWISPIIQTLRDNEAAEIKPGVDLGRAVITALGMGTGITHMEWFRDRDGAAVFGEIAARPPGANMVDLMNFSDDADLYRAWAEAVCWGRAPAVRAGGRPWSAAIVFKRAEGEGTIWRIAGMEGFRSRFGAHIAREEMLPVGAHRRNWKETFLSDGNVIVRHPNEGECRRIAQIFADSIHMYAR